jgi:DNA repair exonuclease SbcCD ATPase subunit
MVEYKANGKMRSDRLDQVVKLAQWGVYNQDREQKVQQVEQAAQQVHQEREQLAALLSEREEQIEKLLMDDDFLLAVRDAYGEQNSPENRAARAEQQVQDIRVQHQMSAIAEKGQVFYENEIAPALDMIAKALPSVPVEELAEKFQMAMYAHVERAPNGEAYVPASRYDAIRQYILDDLAVWAQAQHGRRSPSTTSAPQRETQKALAERDKARIESQKAKRAVGQKTLPVGNAGKPSGKPKAPAGNTIDDAVASALSTALSSFR